jgi:Fur family peroxide stress response transcriptional regulator
MKIRGEEIRERLERMITALRRAGVRLTPQRLEIYREAARTDEHPDAEAIYRRIRKRLPAVSLDTVYRTLWLFKDLGLITALGGIHERTRFDANARPHHHFVCRQCGAIRDFDYDADREWKPPHSVKAIGEVHSTHIELRGICVQCKNKLKRPTKSTK